MGSEKEDRLTRLQLCLAYLGAATGITLLAAPIMYALDILPLETPTLAAPALPEPPPTETDASVQEKVPKPQFRPRVKAEDAEAITARHNLQELSKYAQKVGTVERDGKLVDVWQSMTHDEKYYLPHRG